MFGYVERFYKNVEQTFEDMRVISSRVSQSELEYAKRYFVKRHPVIGEDDDVCKFIKWYVKNYEIVHLNYISEVLNGKN